MTTHNTQPYKTTEVFLTSQEIALLERIVAKEHFMTRYSVDQSTHTMLGHLADTLAEA